MHLGNTIVTATLEHSFWVNDAGWTVALELEPGMTVATGSGTTVAVEAVEILDRAGSVHNIEVSAFHTYFVSDERVLVHDVSSPGREIGRPAQKALERAPRNIRNSVDRIERGHVDGQPWHAQVVGQREIFGYDVYGNVVQPNGPGAFTNAALAWLGAQGFKIP